MSYALLMLGFLPLVLWSGADIETEEENHDDHDFGPLAGETLPPLQEDHGALLFQQDTTDELLSPIIEDDTSTAGPPFNPEEETPLNTVDTENLWISFDETAGTNVVEIMRFDTETDVLDIVIDPESVTGAVNLSVRPVPGSDDFFLYVEGERIAIFRDPDRPDFENLNIIVARL